MDGTLNSTIDDLKFARNTAMYPSYDLDMDVQPDHKCIADNYSLVIAIYPPLGPNARETN